jgi:hypothetical protein
MGKSSDEKYKGAADHWRDKAVPRAELWTCGWGVNRTIHGKLLSILLVHRRILENPSTFTDAKRLISETAP